MRNLELVVLDRENAFLLYATFCGDVVRTAAACGVRPIDILKIAEELKWNDRLKPIIELSKGKNAGDIERGINRAVNYTQAHRMRSCLDRAVRKLCDMTPEELEEYLLYGNESETGVKNKKLTTRALADLASALEKVHALTYQALGDTAPERSRRAEIGSSESSSELHVKIAEAMQAARNEEGIRAQLADAQLETAKPLILRSRLAKDIKEITSE